MSFTIGNIKVGTGARPFIIAEMSGNHNQSIERALAIVDAAAEAGVQAIKLQTYRADTITLKSSADAFTIKDKDSLWSGKNLHQLYSEAYTPWEWHKQIFDHAKAKGLICFSSPFDETAVDFLEELNVPLYKIASFENNHHPLLKKVAATGKPVIMSTGVITLPELEESVAVLRDAGCKDLVLLKCTSTYPSTPENTNLRTIPDLQKRFGCEVGLSDHTMGIGAAVAAIALGATVIEKHFTLRRADGGVDSAFSMEPEEMRSLVIESERAALAMGTVTYELTPKEAQNRRFKRSLFVVAPIKAGEILTAEHLKVVRPVVGLEPRYYDRVIGKKVKRDLNFGDPLTMEDVAW